MHALKIQRNMIINIAIIDKLFARDNIVHLMPGMRIFTHATEYNDYRSFYVLYFIRVSKVYCKLAETYVGTTSIQLNTLIEQDEQFARVFNRTVVYNIPLLSLLFYIKYKDKTYNFYSSYKHRLFIKRSKYEFKEDDFGINPITSFIYLLVATCVYDNNASSICDHFDEALLALSTTFKHEMLAKQTSVLPSPLFFSNKALKAYIERFKNADSTLINHVKFLTINNIFSDRDDYYMHIYQHVDRRKYGSTIKSAIERIYFVTTLPRLRSTEIGRYNYDLMHDAVLNILSKNTKYYDVTIFAFMMAYGLINFDTCTSQSTKQVDDVMLYIKGSYKSVEAKYDFENHKFIFNRRTVNITKAKDITFSSKVFIDILDTIDKAIDRTNPIQNEFISYLDEIIGTTDSLPKDPVRLLILAKLLGPDYFYKKILNNIRLVSSSERSYYSNCRYLLLGEYLAERHKLLKIFNLLYGIHVRSITAPLLPNNDTEQLMITFN